MAGSAFSEQVHSRLVPVRGSKSSRAHRFFRIESHDALQPR
jgi:hypothetical protein